MIEVVKYNRSFITVWNNFISTSKNGVFLFNRNYMDYHADRFQDQSLLFFHKNKLIALLPAHRNGAVLFSHAGLTFGGLVTDKRIRVELMFRLFDAMTTFLKKAGVKRVVYKAIPHIYHIMPAEEDLCALFRSGARLFRRDISLCLRPGQTPILSARRKRALRKGRKLGVTSQRSRDFGPFMGLLEHLLKSKYNTRPVHTLEEIELLAKRFTANIKLYTAALDNEILAGVIVFEHPRVAHIQYIATSANGRKYGGLDVLINDLLENNFKDKHYFDFGTSNSQDGTELNRGVVMNKESYGARTIAYDFYELFL